MSKISQTYFAYPTMGPTVTGCQFRLSVYHWVTSPSTGPLVCLCVLSMPKMSMTLSKHVRHCMFVRLSVTVTCDLVKYMSVCLSVCTSVIPLHRPDGSLTVKLPVVSTRHGHPIQGQQIHDPFARL